MADNLKIDVDFTGKGSNQVNEDIKKVEMSAKELERELKALAGEYGKLKAQMYLLKQAGLENTAEFKLLAKTSEELKGKIGVLGQEYQAAGEKTKLFRERALNLGADLTILSFGFKSIIGDVNDFRKEVSQTNPDVVKLGGSIASASVSALAMVPSLNALRSALATTGLSVTAATGFVALFAAGLALMVNTVRDVIVGFGDFKKVLDGTLDVSKAMDDHISRLTFGLYGTADASDVAADSIFNLGQEMKRFMLIQDQFNPSTVTFGDIQKRFTNSNTNFADQYKKVVDGTASLQDANLVLTKLQERQKELKGDDLKLVNQTIDATNKYISTLQKAGLDDKKKTSGRGNRTPKEKDAELTFLQELRKKEKEYNDLIVALKTQLDDVNIKGWERLSILEKIASVEKQRDDLRNKEVNRPKSIDIGSDPVIADRDHSRDAELQAILDARLQAQKDYADGVKAIYDDLASAVGTSMGTFFASFVPEQNPLTPFQQLMKSIVLAMLNAVEGMIKLSIASMIGKGILTGGISLLTEAPLLVAALAALEVAKGFIGGFANGGLIQTAGNRSSDSGIARVSNGEMIMNARAVQSNYPALQAMNRGGSMGGNDTTIYFSADLAAFTKQTKKSQRDIRQQSKWKRF